MKKKTAPLWIALAGCLWGAMGLFVRAFNAYGISSMNIVLIRSVFTAGMIFAFAGLRSPAMLKVKWKDLWIFAATGLCSIVFFNFCYFSAISAMSMSAAAILLYTSPIFVMLLSALFFRERITIKKLLAIALSILGLAFVTGVFSSRTSLSTAGILYGIGSAFGYALYSIFSRLALNRGYSPLSITGWSFAFAGLFSLFFCDIPLLTGLFSAQPGMIGYSLVFALLVSVAPYMLYSYGLTGTENSTAAVIASVEPVAATLLGILAYREYPSPDCVLGIVLVLAAVVMCIDRTPNKK